MSQVTADPSICGSSDSSDIMVSIETIDRSFIIKRSDRSGSSGSSGSSDSLDSSESIECIGSSDNYKSIVREFS